MSKHGFALHLLFAITLALGAGCNGDDDGDKLIVCQRDDSSACATQKSSCLAGCGASEACLRECQLDFCSCLEAAKCDPPSECRIDPNNDGDGGLSQEDSGSAVDEDSGSAVDEDSGSAVDEDSGELPAEDTLPISCPQEDSTQCALDKTSCVALCLADESCLDDCQLEFCDCLNFAGCAPPPECLE